MELCRIYIFLVDVSCTKVFSNGTCHKCIAPLSRVKPTKKQFRSQKRIWFRNRIATGSKFCCVFVSVFVCVCLSVGLSVKISLEGREVSLPCSYRSTCKHIYADIAFQAISILNSRFHAISFPLKLTRNKHYCGPDRQWRRGTTGGGRPLLHFMLLLRT